MSLAIKFEADAKYPVWTTQGQDHKAWAKRILYRAERGDKDITVLQVAFAKEAMSIKEIPQAG